MAARTGWAALALMLSGCAAMPDIVPVTAARLEPLRTEQAGERVLTLGGQITVSHWRAEGEARAVILGVHGYGDYGSSTFAAAARDWAAQGIEVYAYDQRGFGRNPSNRVWPGAAALIDDLGRVAELIAARHPDLPLTLAGHSMGGAVVAAALGEGRVRAARAVLLAPAFWGGPTLNPLYRAAAWGAAVAAPEKRWTGKGIVRIQASDNIEVLRALGRDPLYVGPPSSREFLGLIRVMDRAYAALPRVTVPVLVLYGEQDQVVPQSVVRSGAARIPNAKFELLPEGWHLLLRDLGAEAARKRVAAFATE